jgi:long-chain-alcohol oxidase
LDKREKVLQKWFKRRFFTAIRIAFIYVKVLCVFVFFSRVMFPSLCKILCSLFFGI